MCGIVGFNWNDKTLLKKASKEIIHRGPDDSGTFIGNNISLGHRRLSIIDLSKSGRQPMSNKKGTIWIVFNGEIYNFKELRKNLEKKYDFKSNTDTEVLIYLYEEHGTDFIKLLQGMFAFCIYDSNKKIFFLARDRLGIKPLYYYNNAQEFMFCSEMKGILKHDKIEKSINFKALDSFLTFRANTSNESFIKKIKKLPPGHLLIYDLKNKKAFTKKYWEINSQVKNKSLSYYTKSIRTLLDSSVKSRLMSDVPYGAYLSGGVDSGSIVSLMNKHSSKEVKTFSVGFENQDHSETEEARFLADKIGTDHHELLISQSSVKNLPQIIYQADEPMSDPTSIPTYLLSKYTKKYCTVVLTGEGADEVFAGYPQYKFMKLHSTVLNKLPGPIKKGIGKLPGIVPKVLLDKGFKFSSALGKKGIERFSSFIEANNASEQYL